LFQLCVGFEVLVAKQGVHLFQSEPLQLCEKREGDDQLPRREREREREREVAVWRGNLRKRVIEERTRDEEPSEDDSEDTEASEYWKETR